MNRVKHRANSVAAMLATLLATCCRGCGVSVVQVVEQTNFLCVESATSAGQSSQYKQDAELLKPLQLIIVKSIFSRDREAESVCGSLICFY